MKYKKQILFLLLIVLANSAAFAQRPSPAQMEADRKQLAEAQKQLAAQLAKMDPAARKSYDSMLNVFGAGTKMNNAIQQVNDNAATAGRSAGLSIDKKNKSKASIAATPTTAAMGAFIGTGSNAVFAAMPPAAKNKAGEIYTALKQKGADADEIGNAAAALWMAGRTQIALGVMAQVCGNDAGNIDNLSNYASMLTMTGAPELAIPILNNLNGRFRKNTTVLNNLGQAWFALGETEKASQYLDSTLALNAGHAQANETKCLIAAGSGNKTAAMAYAKAAFKQGATQERKDKLRQLGYSITGNDYNSFPPANTNDDLLQLGGFSMPPFPKSVEECKALEPVWKQFRKDIDQQMKPLQKITEESNKGMVKQLEAQQKQFMSAMNQAVNNPGSVSQQSALAIAAVPMFSEEMNARQNIVLQNLQKKKQAVLRMMSEFRNGEGAAMRKKYEDAMHKIDEKWKDVGQGGSANNEALCLDAVKAANEFLQPYNGKMEELYKAYLDADKQLLNELSYSALYTSYPEMLPGIHAGLKMQWLRDLSLTLNGFNYESVTRYECVDAGDGKAGKLATFKDPRCNINSEFSQSLGVANLGFSIKIDCSGLSTSFNLLAIGVKLNQDLDHAGFGDSFKSCTVSFGPKVSAGGKIGPLEASANVGGGFDVEIDRTGVKDVVVKAGAEIESGFRNPGIKEPGLLGTAASGSVGVEGRMSIISGVGAIQGTGMIGK
ncbi:hypothetical protein [Chitinophaga caseinilytica]|uniref:Tetratricopeptide repeat protein n=1 Tax=Chitinophaga caseinilytica TaxID=2267521 RepID=A0ABZ2Z704_9BACT